MKFMKKIIKQAITRLIWHKLKRDYLVYQPKLIAITGSVGKTTTMQFVLDLLGSQAIGKPALNTPIGLPLALYNVELPRDLSSLSQWLRLVFKIFSSQALLNKKFWVMEWGVDRVGDMDKFLHYLQPDIGIITGISGVHLEHFNSIEEILNEKWKLIKAAKEMVMINADFANLVKKSKDDNVIDKITAKEIVFYGGKSNNSKGQTGIHLSNFQYSLDKRSSSFRVCFEKTGEDYSCQSKIFSPTTAICCLPGFYIAQHLAYSLKKIIIKIESFQEYKGRGGLLSGKNKSLIIDSSYNASPIAVSSLIEAIEQIKTKRKIVYILGDNNELGKNSQKIHFQIGKLLSTKKVDYLICFGDKAQDIKLGFQTYNKKTRVSHYLKQSEVVRDLLNFSEKNLSLLVFKGSQGGIYLEEIVKELLEDPKDQDKLVRQNDFWMKKKQFI